MHIKNDHIPLKRPHFQLRGNQLFFLISKRPHLELDAVDLTFWKGIDGVTTIGELQERFPSVHESVERLWKSAVIELAPAAFNPFRKRVLIIEPHMDDAVLSVGGLMWKHREQCEFTVASVTGCSNFTSYYRINRDYFDVDTVTTLRRSESDLVMRVLGGKHVVLDMCDAPLRYQSGNWTLEWYVRNRRAISAFVNHSSTDEEVVACAKSIKHMMMNTEAQEIWIPLGVGTSVDHEMTRNACLWALLQLTDLCHRVTVFFYQDVPYALNYPLHTDQTLSALVARGALLERVVHDVTASMPAKLRLISIFASQFKMAYMQPKVEATAQMAGQPDDCFSELLVRVQNPPDRIDVLDVYSGLSDIIELCGRLGDWLQRNRLAESMSVICPKGVGRWTEDMDFLLRTFPNTTFVFYIIEDAADETHRLTSPRIDIRPVKGQAWAWMLIMLKVLFLRSRPLIILTGTKYRHLQRCIRAISVFCDSLPATTIDHLVQALRAHKQTSC